MIEWIRTSRLSIKNSLPLWSVRRQDCAAIKGTVQMLEMLTNLSHMEFACITAASKSVPTHRDLQAQTFAGLSPSL